jgi:hypothetical protein
VPAEALEIRSQIYRFAYINVKLYNLPVFREGGP